MRTTGILVAAISTVLTAAYGVAQHVFVVSPIPGPGVFSSQIQPAVDAASDGDIVLVKPILTGPYQGFAIAGKSLAIVRDSGNVFVNDVEIAGLGPAQRVVLQRLQLGFSSTPFAPLHVHDGSGCTWVDGGRFDSATDAVDAIDAGALVLNGCVALASEIAEAGGAGLLSQGTAVAWTDPECTGGHGGGPGVQTDGPTYVSGGKIDGGPSGAGTAPAISMSGPVVLLDCLLNVSSGPPAVGGTPTVLHDKARHFAIGSPVREGHTTIVDFQGEPNEVVAAFVSEGVSPAVASPLPGLNAPLWIDPATLVATVVFGTTDLSGHLGATIPIGGLPPGVDGTTLFVQSVFVSPQGTPHLGPARALVILDSSL
ncbi:MAG TPA: hypothetical protein VKE69_14965 [Planctomycetota bacterium]|nr:hypothetical protein [Planctomycetota bacterium]